jgi:hypothetical protein
MGVTIHCERRPTERAPWAFLLGIALVVVGAGCGSTRRATTQPTVCAVSDRLRAHVTHLATTIGPRDQSKVDAANEAARWVEGEFRKVASDKVASNGAVVDVQRYEVKGATHFNVSLEIRGGVHPREIVIVGAHYDTAPDTPGADDNASGVAGVIELARRFSGADAPARTIRFVAFGTEEPPAIRTADMGSYHYAKRCRERNENVVAMLSIELIGYYSDAEGSQERPFGTQGIYPSVGNFLVFVGDTWQGPMARHSRDVFNKACGMPGNVMILSRYLRGANSSDQWSFWQWRYPGIMVTDTAFWRNKNYHMPTDTPGTLDYVRMAQAVDGIEGVLRDWTSDKPLPPPGLLDPPAAGKE